MSTPIRLLLADGSLPMTGPLEVPGIDSPTIDALDTRITAVEVAQSAGLLGFETKALLDADLDHAEGVLAYVTNDATAANNGVYIKAGAAGAGLWTQSSFDRVALVEASVTDVEDRATVVEADIAAANAARRTTTITQGVLPVGWIEPDDYTGITYRNDYGVRFFSDGERVHAMLPDAAATRAEWRTGLVRVRHEDDGLYYVSISVADMLDPILQGTAPTVYHVNGATGNDTTGDGSSGTPWATVSKAITEINASVDDLFEVRLSHTSYFGNGGGFNAANYTLNADKQVTITGQDVGGEKPWWLPMQRNSYTKALFAWTDMGNGIWKCTSGSISNGAKATKIVFDLSVLDEEGAPTPSEWLAGPYADEAAILAAMADRPSFHSPDAATLYVKLASGDEPDPGVNFAYTEFATGNTWLLNEGSRLCIRNLRSIHNAGTASGSTLWYFRPQTVTTGAAAVNPFYDIQVILVDCEHYGSSGNAWRNFDIERFVVSNCRDAYCWLDGVNSSTFWTYPANSSSVEEALYQHTWVEDHVSRFHGPNGFRDQPAVNNSANSITNHSRGRTTAINCRGGHSNGSNFAVVGGAKALALNCNMYAAKTVTPASSIYQANYLVFGAAVADALDGSEIWTIHCTGYVRPTGAQFYAEGAEAVIIAAEFRGHKSTEIVSSGTVEDGYGVAL